MNANNINDKKFDAKESVASVHVHIKYVCIQVRVFVYSYVEQVNNMFRL